MASHAICNVADTFLGMLGSYPRGLMLMAPVASVPLIVRNDVARRTGHGMITIKHEIPGMIEARRFPGAIAVASQTVCAVLAVQ
jgi:hypothetical protein